ncbi:hypothetical protein [Lysobacter sp. F6437]|uniref:hypothetical protein n=1 Tax=Lysobacter sp. F6437 TaxID=3459296 RepID=UPI00403E1030
MDMFLKIWAIGGPLLTAVVSALWARHVQVQDRDHQRSLTTTARQAAIEDRNAQFTAERAKIYAAEAKAAFSGLLAIAHHYAMANDQQPANSGLALAEAGTLLHERYSAAALVGNTATSVACYELCRAAARMPENVDENGVFTNEATETFTEARQRFVEAVHDYLESLAKA